MKLLIYTKPMIFWKVNGHILWKVSQRINVGPKNLHFDPFPVKKYFFMWKTHKILSYDLFFKIRSNSCLRSSLNHFFGVFSSSWSILLRIKTTGLLRQYKRKISHLIFQLREFLSPENRLFSSFFDTNERKTGKIWCWDPQNLW